MCVFEFTRIEANIKLDSPHNQKFKSLNEQSIVSLESYTVWNLGVENTSKDLIFVIFDVCLCFFLLWLYFIRCKHKSQSIVLALFNTFNVRLLFGRMLRNNFKIFEEKIKKKHVWTKQCRMCNMCLHNIVVGLTRINEKM